MELVAPHFPSIDQDPLLQGFLQGGRDVQVLDVVSQPAQLFLAEDHPDDRCERKHTIGRLGKPVHAHPDHLPHPFRNLQAPAGEGAGISEGALAVQQPHQLLHEQGVALGLTVDGLQQPILHGPAGHNLHESCDLLLRETAESDPPKGLLPTQAGEHALEGMAAPQLGVTIGAQDQHP